MANYKPLACLLNSCSADVKKRIAHARMVYLKIRRTSFSLPYHASFACESLLRNHYLCHAIFLCTHRYRCSYPTRNYVTFWVHFCLVWRDGPYSVTQHIFSDAIVLCDYLFNTM